MEVGVSARKSEVKDGWTVRHPFQKTGVNAVGTPMHFDFLGVEREIMLQYGPTRRFCVASEVAIDIPTFCSGDSKIYVTMREYKRNINFILVQPKENLGIVNQRNPPMQVVPWICFP